MNNAEKLFGKNGELVEMRKRQVLIGAAEILKQNCEKNLAIGPCDCAFNDDGRCKLVRCNPSEWDFMFFANKIVHDREWRP